MGKGIERHITFHVLPEKVEEFGIFFKQEYRPAMENTNGFVKAELLKGTENPQDLKMVLRFDSSDAAAGWRLPNHTLLSSLA
jgi:heme-degrading monooxygenase HmoA